jgi:dihydroorotase
MAKKKTTAHETTPATSKLLLRGGRVFDPGLNLDFVGDILIDKQNGLIRQLGPGLKADRQTEIRDCRDLLLCPGFIDIHVHFREPGYESKETIATGSAAAVHGGFAAVATMPNTDPPLDNEATVAYQLLRDREAGGARVYPIGCITVGRQGKELAGLGLLARAGAVAFSDDGAAVPSARVLRYALEYAKSLNRPIIEHCEDAELSGGAIMHEGLVSASLGINGSPAAAEELIVARDLRLCELTGGRLHIAHVSTAGSAALIREAKRKGLPVTAEVAPHHLLLTDELCRTFDPLYKVNPPLRSAADAAACREALRTGVIDAIASDHAPHSAEEKAREFVEAPHGIIGLESTVGVLLTDLVAAGELSLERMVTALTGGPAKALGLPGGVLEAGGPADVTILDLNRRWTLNSEKFHSKGRNCPFAGRKLKGLAVETIVGGRSHKNDWR